MDDSRFDTLVKTFSTPDTRRGTLRFLLGAVLGGLLPGDSLSTAARKQRGKGRKKGDRSPKQQGDTGAQRQRGIARTERCLFVGERCPKRLEHGKQQKRHSCERGCCTGYAAVASDGKRRCACKPNGAPCTQETARQCCAQVCTGAVCGTGGQPAPVAPPRGCAETCAGCCDTSGTCQAGTTDAACGTGGTACVACRGTGVTCGGGDPGTPGICGCTPTTCAAEGAECGSIPNGCGETLECGTCSNPTPICVGTTCTACSPDNPCPAGQLCDGGACQSCGDVCPSGCAYPSVQAAIDDPNGPSTIRICAGTYVGNLVITRNVTLIGAGQGEDPATNTILDAAGSGRVVLMERVTVTLQNLHITGGGGGPGGGGILNDQGTLTLIDTTVTRNTVRDGGGGGGIYSIAGSVTLSDSTVTRNSATSGGGIYNDFGMLTLSNSTISGNTATNGGGGITNNIGTVTLDGTSRVTGNTAPAGEGGGIHSQNGGAVILANEQNVTDNTGGNCAPPNTIPNCVG